MKIDNNDLRAIARARTWRKYQRKYWLPLGVGFLAALLISVVDTIPIAIMILGVIISVIIINRRFNREYKKETERMVKSIDEQGAPIIYVFDNYHDLIYPDKKKW